MILGGGFPGAILCHAPINPYSLQVDVRLFIWWRIRVGDRVPLHVDLFVLAVFPLVFLEGALLACFIIVSLPGYPCDFLNLFCGLEELYWFADSQ